LPPQILTALHDGFKKALHDPAHIAMLERLFQPLEYLNSADYARNMAETIDMEEARVKRLGLSTG
jgi:tripartite-type tricarboxylate transporter receptor subunit TctC